jgi:hypothetical protein
MKSKKFGVTHTPRRISDRSEPAYISPVPIVPTTSSNTVVLVPVINKFVRGERASDKTCFKVLDEHVHQAIGVGVWKWIEQNVVDDAVDDRDRANAKRERQDRGCREARRAGQRAKRVAYVSLQIFEPDERSRVALLFLVCSTRPNARRAAVRASSDVIPWARKPSSSSARWAIISRPSCRSAAVGRMTL